MIANNNSIHIVAHGLNDTKAQREIEKLPKVKSSKSKNNSSPYKQLTSEQQTKFTPLYNQLTSAMKAYDKKIFTASSDAARAHLSSFERDAADGIRGGIAKRHQTLATEKARSELDTLKEKKKKQAYDKSAEKIAKAILGGNITRAKSLIESMK